MGFVDSKAITDRLYAAYNIALCAELKPLKICSREATILQIYSGKGLKPLFHLAEIGVTIQAMFVFLQEQPCFIKSDLLF